MSDPKNPPDFETPSGAWSRRRWLAASGLIFAAALAAYWNSFHGPLVLDDELAIAKNPAIRHLWPLKDVLFPPAYSGPSGRPVLNLSFALNYAVGGEQVFGYHLVNFTLHVLAGMVLFDVVRRLLRSPRLRQRFVASADWLAAATVLLWIVHPLQTESVTYLSQRAETLMALFYLLALDCFLRAAADTPASRRCYLLSITFCWLGMATKEVMVTAPVVVFACDAFLIAGTIREAWRARRLYYTGLVTSWMLLAWLMITFSRRSVGFHEGVSPGDYALTECQAIVRYVGLSFWPHPLVFDYGPALAGGLLSWLPSALILLLFVAGLVMAVRRAPAAAWLGASFLVLLAPTSSIVPVALQPIAENRMYLPLAVVLAGLVLAVERALGPRARWLPIALAISSITLTARRNEDYRDALAIWRDTVTKRPDNPRAHDSFGSALAQAGRTDEAMQQFRQAVQLAPALGRIHFNLGKALQDGRRTGEAIHEYEEAVRLEPSNADAHINLATAWAEVGRNDQAETELECALRLNPGDARAHYDLGLVFFHRGQFEASIREYQRSLDLDPAAIEPRDALGTALFRLGRANEAVRHYERALLAKPDFAAAHNNLGNVQITLGRLREAREHFERALQLKPDYSQAHTGLGVVDLQCGEVPEASREFAAALRLDPADAEAHFRLGNILAMGGDMPGAMTHWQESLRFRPDDAEAHNNLAIGLAQTGRIAEAIRHYEEALRLRPGYALARDNLAELRARNGAAAGEK